MTLRDELLDLLKPFDQLHLLDGWESLNMGQRQNLADQIRSQDFAQLATLFAEQSKPHDERFDAEGLSPMPFHLGIDNPRREMWLSAGEEALSQGQAAAFLVAGGQGSRLGFEGPKGAFRIGLPSGKSIFQIQAERLLRLQRLYGKEIPWCIMTSPLNHVETIAHFEENQFFGLNQQMICFFPQAMIAAMDTQGRVLREAPDRLALVPDGNGGCFRALSRSGCLDWLASHGVRFIFLYSVDNVLVKICDPFFLGALACTPDMQSASKVVSKRSADEKVGIFAFRNGKPSVVEYTDLPPALRDAKTTEGGLQFDGGNIAVHLFRLEALRKLENKPLPWHAAFKKISFWTPDGISQPAEPNAWKFEQFLFDAFPILGSMIPFGVEREDEFAPVKNATGNDSPASARKMIGELHRNWLTRAKSPVAPNTLYEISPLLSYAGEGLDGAMLESRLGTDIWSFQE